MEASNHEPRRRASLRGKGRAILLGERELPAQRPERLDDVPLAEQPEALDPAALRLTPEEIRALFDVSAPLPGLGDLPLTAVTDRQHSPQAAPASSPPQRPAEGRAQDTADDLLSDLPDWLVRPDLSDDMPVIVGRSKLKQAVAPVADAQPLAEREAALPEQEVRSYQARSEVESLIPPAPETWSGAPAPQQPADRPLAAADVVRPASTEQVVQREAVVPAPSEVPSPVVPGPDTTVLVDDERLRRLAQQIEALQDDLARHPIGDPQVIDGYQQALAEADRLLAASRANYDTVRARVYRIRTEITRRRKIEADIARYRPLLLNYLVGWVIALVVLFLLKALFAGVGEAVGVPVVAALYYPLLFGIGGALLSGYLTLERHTTRLRDFDPIHISWYLINPLLGGVMGLLMFLIATLANQDLLRESASDAEYAITYLLCTLAGMNQTPILHALHEVMRYLGRSS
ncbi:MAG: hypothetical protein ACUVSU_10275 [Aggregatilineaceae bacterium]